ncbi:putative 50 kDa midgut protein, partial [Operophtera brumata]
MSEEEAVDIEQELDDLLTKVQPNLQDVIKRSFTNVILQQSKNGEQVKPDTLPDTSYFAKNTQVNLSRLELLKPPTFHMQALLLDLKSMGLTFRCSLGEVSVKGLYSAFNENLYNLIPVLSEGHFVISLSNMTADVTVGLALTFSFINPGIDFTHDEVLVKLSWPSPQRNGGYEFATTEQLAKHIAISLPLYALLRERLQRHLALVLRQATSVSDVISMIDCLTQSGNKVMDMILINMRRTLLQNRREVLAMPPLHATFMHK